ncbi:MAG: hypothetical protein V9E94_04715 [Microthrixaceae bacterium]
MLVAPFNLHSRTQELINAEAANAAAGRPARIIAKMNKLVDPVTIENLYAASQAGVKIDLIVRATCCLLPGVKGLSENIRLRNIVGRFLEHARIFYFENAGQPLVYCGSADWMSRNFFRRVEALFPVEEPDLRRRLIEDLLPIELRDNEDARELQSPDGTYAPVPRAPGEEPFRARSISWRPRDCARAPRDRSPRCRRSRFPRLRELDCGSGFTPRPNGSTSRPVAA